MATAAANKVKPALKSVKKCAKSTDVPMVSAARSARRLAKKQAMLIAKKASAATVKKRKGLHKQLPEGFIQRLPLGWPFFLYTHANMHLIYHWGIMPLILFCITQAGHGNEPERNKKRLIRQLSKRITANSKTA